MKAYQSTGAGVNLSKSEGYNFSNWKRRGPDVVLWAPRIVGLGLAAFLALLALDSLSGPHTILETVIAFAMGLLPAAGVLAVVIIGWKHQGVAAILFAVFAVIYSVSARNHPEWILLIAGPLVLVAILFLVSWRARSRKF
jgi:hypothetical protein